MNRVKLTKTDVKEINSMLVPIMIEQAFLSSIGLLISFLLKETGPSAVASVGLMNNFNILISNVFQSFGVGVAVTIAQYCGRKDYSATGKVALQGLLLSFGASLVLFLSGMLFREGILRLLLSESEEQVYFYSRIYFTNYLYCVPFISIYTVASATLRGSGHSKTSLIPILVYNFLYAALSALSVFVLDLGFEGVCRSQLTGAIIAAVIGIALVVKGNESIHIEKFTLNMDPKVIKPMMKIGIPVLIENTFFSLGRLITQTFAVPYGTNSIAANGLVNNINNIMSVPVISAISAAPPIVGKYCGMGDKKTAMDRSRQLTTLIVLMQCVISIIALIIINPLLSVITDVEEVRELIKPIIILKAFVQPLGYTLSFVWPACMRSAGDAKYVMIVNTLTMFIARLGIAYLLTHVIPMNILGIWIGQYSDWFIRIIFFWKRFRSGKWLEFSIFDDDKKVSSAK